MNDKKFGKKSNEKTQPPNSSNWDKNGSGVRCVDKSAKERVTICILLPLFLIIRIMKNKWMSREVQHLLPEGYDTKQCGVVKLFCTYFKGGIEQEWKDPGIVGIGALIQHQQSSSTYIRIYELDDVYSGCAINI